MTTVDGKKSWMFTTRVSAIPNWQFATAEGDLVAEPTMICPDIGTLYAQLCPDMTTSLSSLIQDLPGPLRFFASYARRVRNHRQRRRFVNESVIEYEEDMRSGSMFPDGCSGNGDGEVVSDDLEEYDDKNLGVALGITTPNWVTFGEVAPRRIDQDKSSHNTDIIKFEEFMTFLKSARNNGLLCDENFIEPIFATDSDQVIARRYIVVVKGISPSLMSIFDDNGEDDSDDEDGDENNNEAQAQPQQQAAAAADANNNMAEDAAGSGRSETRSNIIHRLKWAINYLWVRYLETGSTDAVYMGKGSDDDDKKKRGFRRKLNEEPHSKRLALQKWQIIAESFGLCQQGAVVPKIMSSDTLCMHNIVHEKHASPPMFAASEVFGLVNCIIFDSQRQEDCVTHEYDPMQTNPLHYMQEAVDVQRLCRATQFPDMCKGITFPPMRRKYADRYLQLGVSTATMCINSDHFLAKSWGNMSNPDDAYMEHLRTMKTKATGRKRKMDPLVAMMARGDSHDMGTIAMANPDMWAKVAAGDESVAVVPVPEARRATDQIREVLMPDGADEEVREMRRKYENPSSLVDNLKQSADVKNFFQNRAELDELMTMAYAKGLEKVCTRDLAELQTRIESVERHAEYLSDSIVKQARTAARSEQYDILSKAQVAVLADKLQMTPEEYCIGEKAINRELSQFANFLNNNIYHWEEVDGVYTAHPSLVVLDASKKSAWIPYPTMRTNVLLQGAAQAGKDYMKSIIVKNTKKGVFQPCGKSTEASQCDPERPHGIGGVKEHSETPVYLDPKHPRYAQEVQDKKTQFTECQHQYTKCERYMRQDGTERQVSTNFKVKTDHATWVNTNEDMSIASETKGGDASLKAMLSRFKLFMQPTPNRSFGALGDNRMYKSKKDGNNNCVKMAEEKFHRNAIQNDLFHAIYSLLVDLGTVPSVDFTVFDAVSAEILRLCERKGTLVTERMRQQLRNDAWVFAIDDWWAKNFMFKSGVFVFHEDDAEVSNNEADAKKDRDVSIPLLVRHLRANPVICSEECTLFAWQILQNSGAASQGVMNHIAMLIKHMVDNSLSPDGTWNKKLDTLTPYKKVMQFFQPPSHNSNGASDGDGFNAMGLDSDESQCDTYECLYMHVPEDTSGGGVPGATHLQNLCETLARYNKQYNVMDKDHNATSMHTTLMHYAKLNENFYGQRFEFRLNNTATGQPESVFAHPDKLWACFSNNMEATEQIMECLGMEFPEDSDMQTRKGMVLHVFSEYCTFSRFAQALNTYRSRSDTRPSMFHMMYTKVRKLVESLWTADEQFIMRSSLSESEKESMFEEAARNSGRYKSLSPMPTAIMFDWEIVSVEMSRTNGGNTGKKEIYFQDNTLKPVALNYISALKGNLGNRLRHGLDVGEDGDEDDAGDNDENHMDVDGDNSEVKVNGSKIKRTRPRIEIVQCKTGTGGAYDGGGGGASRWRGGGGGFRNDYDGGGDNQSRNAVPLNYVKFDIQAILAWASAARSNADRSDIIEEYMHNNIVSRRVVLHQMSRDYKSLGTMELKRNSGKSLLVRNPQFCSEDVSNRLVTTASNSVRKEWAKQRRYTALCCDIDNMSFVRICNESMARRNYSISNEIQSRNDPDFPISDETLNARYKVACITNLCNPYRYMCQADVVYGGRHGTDFMPQNSSSLDMGINHADSHRYANAAAANAGILSLPEFSIPKKDQEDIRKILSNEVSMLSTHHQQQQGDASAGDDGRRHSPAAASAAPPPLLVTTTTAHTDIMHMHTPRSGGGGDRDEFRQNTSEFFKTTVVDIFSAVSAKVEADFMNDYVYPNIQTVQVDMYAYDEARPRLGDIVSQLSFNTDKYPLGTPTFAYFQEVVTVQKRILVNCIVAMSCKLARMAEGDAASNTTHRSIAAVFDGSDISRGGCQEHTKCMKYLARKDVMLFRVTLDIRDSVKDITKGEFSTDTLIIEYKATADDRLGKGGRFGDAIFTMNMMSMGYVIRSMYTQHKVSKWLLLQQSQNGGASKKRKRDSPSSSSCGLPLLRKPCVLRKQKVVRTEDESDGDDEEEEDVMEDNGVVGLSQGYMMKL